MSIRSLMRKALQSRGYEVYNRAQPHVYSEDGLSTIHNHDFIRSDDFRKAYARGIKANGADHFMQWRAHIAYWVVRQAIRQPGDFVECGVSTGFLASGIMDILDWNNCNRTYFMFDTWQGLDERFLSDAEKSAGRLDWYSSVNFDSVRENFSEYKNVQMIQGAVPETLTRVPIDQVCYLSLDMNCTEPEIAAAEFFWPKMVKGGFMLLDDYAYSGYQEQNEAFNRFAAQRGIEILSLPTGQGLVIKP